MEWGCYRGFNVRIIVGVMLTVWQDYKIRLAGLGGGKKTPGNGCFCILMSELCTIPRMITG
jgi:hypothetical protein